MEKAGLWLPLSCDCGQWETSAVALLKTLALRLIRPTIPAARLCVSCVSVGAGVASYPPWYAHLRGTLATQHRTQRVKGLALRAWTFSSTFWDARVERSKSSAVCCIDWAANF